MWQPSNFTTYIWVRCIYTILPTVHFSSYLSAHAGAIQTTSEKHISFRSNSAECKKSVISSLYMKPIGTIISEK